MHGAVLHAFYLEASGLSVMHSSVARRDPPWQGGEGARGGTPLSHLRLVRLIARAVD